MITDTLLAKHSHSFHKLFQPDLHRDNTLILDLSAANPKMKHLDYSNTHSLGKVIFEEMQKKGLRYAYGGYLEDREVYRRSPLFAGKAEEARSIHLGIDVWTAPGTPVYLPVDGKVHSFQNNDQFGDYGPTIIMAHELAGESFFTLYGHLSEASLENLREGMPMEKGTVLCHVGDAPVNGDWPPHLHFQVIADMQGLKGDFPGVSFVSEQRKFRKLCPDPGVFFQGL